MHTSKINIDQTEVKLKAFTTAKRVTLPSAGWVKTVRLTLGMSLKQLAKKLNITKQSAQEIEKREQDGSITIKSLREAARALDMELVYGFAPKDGSLEALIDRKARILALEIVSRTSNTMKLEAQENSPQRVQRAVAERVTTLKNEMPKILWD